MAYAYDIFGWFSGVCADGAPRSTVVPPANLNTSSVPGAQHANWTGNAWTDLPYAMPPQVDPHAALRAALWEQIKAERERRKAGGTKVGANWFHSDTDSRIQQIGLVLMGAAVPPVSWKLLGGGAITMSQTLAGQIFGAVAASDLALHAYAEALKAQVNAAADPHAIDISAGWPDTFGG